MKCNFNKLK